MARSSAHPCSVVRLRMNAFEVIAATSVARVLDRLARRRTGVEPPPVRVRGAVAIHVATAFSYAWALGRSPRASGFAFRRPKHDRRYEGEPRNPKRNRRDGESIRRVSRLTQTVGQRLDGIAEGGSEVAGAALGGIPSALSNCTAHYSGPLDWQYVLLHDCGNPHARITVDTSRFDAHHPAIRPQQFIVFFR